MAKKADRAMASTFELDAKASLACPLTVVAPVTIMTLELDEVEAWLVAVLVEVAVALQAEESRFLR